MDPHKVAAIIEWAPPVCCTDVWHFVCLANYYCKFVLLFSHIAAPLTALVGPKASFSWGLQSRAASTG
jgi:hypothetical protein